MPPGEFSILCPPCAVATSSETNDPSSIEGQTAKSPRLSSLANARHSAVRGILFYSSNRSVSVDSSSKSFETHRAVHLGAVERHHRPAAGDVFCGAAVLAAERLILILGPSSFPLFFSSTTFYRPLVARFPLSPISRFVFHPDPNPTTILFKLPFPLDTPSDKRQFSSTGTDRLLSERTKHQIVSLTTWLLAFSFRRHPQDLSL